MTSATSPSGVVTASGEINNMLAYYVFDANGTNYWQSNGATNQWVAYESVNPYIVKSVSITPYEATTIRVKNFIVQGSNNGTDWDNIYSGVCQATASKQTFKFANEQAFTHHRLLVVDHYGTDSIMITQLQFYGKAND